MARNVFLGRVEERFPSGQREQTVNLPAMPSKVRILPSPPFLYAGIAQLVEREPSKLGVAGSSPVSRSKLLVARWQIDGLTGLGYGAFSIYDKPSTGMPR